jgi:hypothetical protein
MPCRIMRRKEWMLKMVLESQTWNGRAVFVTLTYDNEHLPTEDGKFPTGNLVKSDLQKFIKRFRKNYNARYSNSKVRYFGVGEYGDKFNRCHYHIVLFNVFDEARPIVEKSWSKGFIGFDVLNDKRINYTLGYTIKKMTSEKEFPDGRQPEFTLMSRMPGLGWFQLPIIAKLLKSKGYIPKFYSEEELWHMKKE